MRPTDVTIGEPLGVGNGNIDAGEHSQEQLEFLENKLQEHRVGVSPDAPICCIDGRCGLHTLGSRGTEPRASVAGGVMTAYAAAELVGLFGEQEGTPLERFTRVAELLEGSGIRVGNHIDEDAELTEDGKVAGTRTGCGANDLLLQHLTNIDQAREGVLSLSAQLLGNDFNAAYTNFTSNDSLQMRLADWNAVDATNALINHNPDSIEVLEGDPESPTHGHKELLVVFNYDENTTIDRDAFVKDTGEQVFVVDMWLIDKLADKLAAGPEAEEMYGRLRHAMVAYQLGTYLTLCNGSQRPAIMREPVPVAA